MRELREMLPDLQASPRPSLRPTASAHPRASRAPPSSSGAAGQGPTRAALLAAHDHARPPAVLRRPPGPKPPAPRWPDAAGGP
eukprot:scaffold128909_cov42-Phaeocystis_antarctica.AAC.1